MKYELVVVWYTGEKEIYEYDSETEAEQGEENMYLAFGRHQLWCCVRKKI